MRPIFLLSFVASAYALQDTFPSDPVGDLTVPILYSDQTGTATAWLASGESGVCSTGTKQSPIDIKMAEAKIPTVDPGMPMLNNFSPKQSFSIDFGPTDGGGLAIYQTDFGIDAADFGVPTLTGGPLDAGDSYNFVFGEFKWHDTTDTLGSEHSIDGTFAPLELQLVHLKSSAAALTAGSAVLATSDWNTHVKAVVDASTVPDPSAVAVVNYQFEIDTVDNPALADIITALEAHALGTAEDYIGTTYNMSALLNPANTNMLEDYYYYDGSLTMPTAVEADFATMGCNEIVRWILPTTKLPISKSQLTAIRAAASSVAIEAIQGPSLARSIQTNANTVYHRKKPTSTDIWKSLATSLLSVGTFGLVHTFLTQPDTAKALTENPIVDVLADFEQRFVNPTSAASQRSAPNHHHHTPQF